MHRFKNLEIWKLGREFCSDIYSVTSQFPDTEKFGIINQLRRAAISVPSNIAEGEIETQLLISQDLGFAEKSEVDSLLRKLDSILKMTSKFKSTLD